MTIDLNSNTKTPRDRAAVYIRVSTQRQKNEGFSPETQKSLAEEYAKRHNWEIAFTFIEDKPASKVYGRDVNTEDVIANFSNRPKFKKLLVLAESKSFNHLIAYSRDRITRVLEEQIALEIFLKKFNVDIHYTKSGENIKNEDANISQFINLILSSFAEYESNLLSSRIKETNKNLISEGFWAGGRAPFGFIRKHTTVNSKKKLTKLETSDFESTIVKRIYELYLQGFSYSKISHLMNFEFSFIDWSKSKIEGIISNQTYTGQIAWNKRRGRRQQFKKHNDEDIIFSPLNNKAIVIDEDIWDACLKLRKYKAKSPDPYLTITPFILKDKLICSKCGRTMIPKNRGKNKSSIYKCYPSKDTLCSCIIPAKKVHNEFINQMNKITKASNYEDLWTIYNDKLSDRKNNSDKFINELDSKIQHYESLLTTIKLEINKESNELIKKALKTQLIAISRLLKEYSKSKTNLKSSYEKLCIKKEDFNNRLKYYFSCIFKNTSQENNNILENHQFELRNFILLFIDKVRIDYEDKNIKAMEIIYKLPEFI